MVFTDLQVVNDNMIKIHDSFWRFQQIDPNLTQNWKENLAQSVVTGCTMIINRAAQKVVLPFIISDMLHDHWISIIIARHGHISYLPNQTILYRQHGTNVLGAQSISLRYLLRRVKYIKRTYHIYRDAIKYFGDISWPKLLILKAIITIKRVLY